MPEGWRELSPSREDWLTEDEWVAWLSRIEPEEWADAGEDPGEARAAEALVLDRAGRLTPGGLRAAIARAAIEVAPGKAARTASRWLEIS